MRVIRRKVKNPRIDLRTGEVVVIAPPGTDVDALIESKREWIERNMERIRRMKREAEEEIKKKGIRILDVEVTVKHNCRNPGLRGNVINICRKRAYKVREDLRRALREDIRKMADVYSSKLGVTPNRIFIKEQTTKWGSCSPSGNLSFNLSLVFLPREFREYVVAHELVHLLYRKHDDKFADTLRSLGVSVPDREKLLFMWYYAEKCKERLMLDCAPSHKSCVKG